jgi:8-oxo-dGTP diphosphatase
MMAVTLFRNQLTHAIIREACEEVGITLDVASLELVHVVHTPPEPGDRSSDERIDFYFRASRFDGTIENREPGKCDDIAWFEPSNPPDNTVPRVRAALRGILAGRPLSEPDWELCLGAKGSDHGTSRDN